jgi:zinc transport system substrate-binding protein
MHLKIRRLLAAVFISAVVLTGCGRSAGNTTGETAGSPEIGGVEFNIVTSFYPVYVATINITKGITGVAVKDMTKPQTGCLHDYSLKPDDLKTLERADAFVINGAGMEAFLDNVIAQQKNLKIVEASRGIKLLKDRSGVDNPHVWVSITNAIIYVNNIASQLSALDTAHADGYKANAAAYVQKLEALKKDMHNTIDGLKTRDIITFHEAFPYFAQEFNLRIAAVIEREPGSEPTQKELGGIIETIQKSGIKALFVEPQYSSKAADTISRETGAKVYELDPVVTGDEDADAYDAYLNAMGQNKKTLQEALK